MQYLLARILDGRPSPWGIVAPLSAVLLVLAVACGAAAPAEPQSASDAVPPGASGAEQNTAGSGAAPTAAPTPASPAAVASTEVHPGKLTWMVGSFANERMTYCLAGGGGHDYGRQIHAFLIESGMEDGARVLEPGIATNWEVSPDGKTWNVTIRDGVKFHDGSEVTIEDVLWTLRWATGPQAVEYSTGG
jgi:ABC-type transport system substrate-binding protein